MGVLISEPKWGSPEYESMSKIVNDWWEEMHPSVTRACGDFSWDEIIEFAFWYKKRMEKQEGGG